MLHLLQGLKPVFYSDSLEATQTAGTQTLLTPAPDQRILLYFTVKTQSSNGQPSFLVNGTDIVMIPTGNNLNSAKYLDNIFFNLADYNQGKARGFPLLFGKGDTVGLASRTDVPTPTTVYYWYSYILLEES